MTAPTIRVPLGSLEYVKAAVTADVTLDNTMTVAISLTPSSGVHSWLASEWTGTAATTRTARTSSPVDFGTLAKKAYNVYVKLVDNPETPIISAGQIVVS